MGKRSRAASKFFRWIKSDLPDCDPSPVLLLGVTAFESPTTATCSVRKLKRRPRTELFEVGRNVDTDIGGDATRNSLVAIVPKSRSAESLDHIDERSAPRRRPPSNSKGDDTPAACPSCLSSEEQPLPSTSPSQPPPPFLTRFVHLVKNGGALSKSKPPRHDQQQRTSDVRARHTALVPGHDKIGQSAPKFCTHHRQNSPLDAIDSNAAVLSSGQSGAAAAATSAVVSPPQSAARTRTQNVTADFYDLTTDTKAAFPQDSRSVKVLQVVDDKNEDIHGDDGGGGGGGSEQDECSTLCGGGGDGAGVQQQNTENRKSSQQKQKQQKQQQQQCRIYGLIPKCTQRADSSCEPTSESVGSASLHGLVADEQNNNLTSHNLRKFGHRVVVGTRSATRSNSINNSVGASAMDRSVDSIGSCSLDVDAESTDFSDTSGSLNLLTPLSGKDFPREFTSRIQERCQLPLVISQQTTTVLDPSSGKIRTILTAPDHIRILHRQQHMFVHTLQQQQQQQQLIPPPPVTIATITNSLRINDEDEDDDEHNNVDVDAVATTKKPSYLNLACCVNGYSNLTTYDSKLRQHISRSREVSPSRPITAVGAATNTSATAATTTTSSSTAARGGDFNLALAPPLPPQLNAFNAKMMENNNNRRTTGTATAATFMTPEKRAFTAQMLHEEPPRLLESRRDCDNHFFKTSSKYRETIVTHTHSNNTTTTSMAATAVTAIATADALPTKSFIQQRVERLYGPGALSAGFYNGKRVQLKETANRTGVDANVVSSNGGGGSDRSKCISDVYANGGATSDKENGHSYDFDKQQQPLPVMRHLRPEFRAQLPLLSSPKRLSMTNGKSTHTINNNINYNHNNHANNNHYNNNNNNHNTNNNINNNNNNNNDNNDHDSNRRTITTSSTAVAAMATTTATTAAVASALKSPPKNNIDVVDRAMAAASVAVPIVAATMPESNSKTPTRLLNLGGGIAATIEKQNSCDSSSSSSGNISRPPAKSLPDSQIDELTILNSVCKMKLIVDGDNDGLSTVADTINKDGNFFLRIYESERDRLLALAVNIENEMNGLSDVGITDEVFGYLRSASGKARLLATKKMKQFEDLCHNNLNQKADEKFQTTSDDLQGFWDMVMLQVDHVDNLFKEIDEMRANEWKKCSTDDVSAPPPQGVKLTKRPIAVAAASASKKSAAAAMAAQKREAQRKQFLELKRRQRMETATASPVAVVDEQPAKAANGSVEIYAPEISS